MVQEASHTRRDIKDTRAAMTEQIGLVEERAQGTVEGLKSTVDQAMKGFKEMQATIEGAKSAIDTIVDTVQLTIDETVERVNTTVELADLIDQVQQHPWLLLGGAMLLGYTLGCLARDTSSVSSHMPDRPRPNHASAPDSHAPSEAR
jgi:ElaB/YqjD/DUF883 family membrane-anchored ribosome-binding protein